MNNAPKQKHLHTDRLLEVVDSQNRLLGIMSERLIRNQSLCHRMVAGAIVDEKRSTLLGLTQDGVLTLPITLPLLAASSSEQLFEEACASLGLHIFNTCFLTTIPPDPSRKSFVVLYKTSASHASLIQLVRTHTFLLLDTIERKNLFSNPMTTTTTLLQAATPYLPS